MVYIDTNIFIYLLEQHGEYSLRVADTLTEFQAKNMAFVTSTITLAEFLAGTSNTSPRTLYQIPNLSFLNVSIEVAERAARLQKDKKLAIGDALHLATALHHEATIVFTNDKQLAKAARDYLSVIMLGE